MDNEEYQELMTSLAHEYIHICRFLSHWELLKLETKASYDNISLNEIIEYAKASYDNISLNEIIEYAKRLT